MQSCNKTFLFLTLVVYFLSEPVMAFAEPIALYRFFNRTADHFYTSNCQEKLNAWNLNKYAQEGITGYIESTQTEGTTPFYRLMKTTNHFYTADINERNAAIQAGYRDEGIVGYISVAGNSDTAPLYRLFNANSGDHFYTTSKQERDNAISKEGYKDEGIAGYIWTTGKTCSSPPPASSSRCVCFYDVGTIRNSNTLYQGACNSVTCQSDCAQKYMKQYRHATCTPER